MRLYQSSNMTQEERIVLRGAKIPAILSSLCELYHLSLIDAEDIYYNSETANLIEEGVADLQCRSHKYLAQVIWYEYKNNEESV